MSRLKWKSTRQAILLPVMAIMLIINLPFVTVEGREFPKKNTVYSSRLLKVQERQQTLQQIKQLKESLLNYYWDVRTFPSTLQGILQNSEATADWNGPYGDEQLLTDVWGNSICYQSSGTVSVPNPYNKDGSFAQIPKVQLWANDPDNRCINGQPPGTDALIVYVQPSISRFNQEARERLNIAVRVFNQSGLTLADLNAVPANQAIEVIPALSEYYQEYGKEKFWWYQTDQLFYSSGLNRIPENGSNDDIIPSIALSIEVTIGIIGTVVDTSAQPVENALVEVYADDEKFSTNTISDGTYAMSVPVSVLPEFFAASASKTGYIPATQTIEKPDTDLITIDFVLEPIGSQTIVTIEQDLHHLGDDTWQPAQINSQFQRASEGLSMDFTFEATGEHTTFSQGIITFKAKGAGGQGTMDEKTELALNNQTPIELPASSSDGSFSDYFFVINPSDLIIGTNTLTLSSGRFPSTGSWDDFEFINILLELQNPENIELTGTHTWIEAEGGLVTGNFIMGNDSQASGNQYMVTTEDTGNDRDATGLYANHYLHFALQSSVSTTYYLWLRAKGPSSSSNSFFVKVNDGSLIRHDTATGNWAWAETGSGFSLGEGNHTLNIYLREDGTLLDKILLTTDADYVPSGTGL